jgi:hypothetical protein
MKNLTLAINLHIHPLLQGMEHCAMPSASLKIEQTWDRIDGIVSELYYDIREVATEILSQKIGPGHPSPLGH